jgi:hypothetical protein
MLASYRPHGGPLMLSVEHWKLGDVGLVQTTWRASDRPQKGGLDHLVWSFGRHISISAHNLTDHKRMVSTMVCGPFGGIYPYPSQPLRRGGLFGRCSHGWKDGDGMLCLCWGEGGGVVIPLYCIVLKIDQGGIWRRVDRRRECA